MPKLYNLRNNDAPRDAVLIARPSRFGNPFTWLTNYTAKLTLIKVESREDSIECYEQLLDCYTKKEVEKLIGPQADPIMPERLLIQADFIRDHLHNLKGKDLVCWCAPLPCHGDVLLRLANE